MSALPMPPLKAEVSSLQWSGRNGASFAAVWVPVLNRLEGSRGMPSLTVWIYETSLGAEAGHRRLRRLVAAEALQVLDAVTVTWVPGAHEPRIRRLQRTVSATGGVSGLTALVMLLPSQPSGVRRGGSRMPARLRNVADGLRGIGIDQEFLEDVSTHVGQGTSALWVLSGDVDFDLVRPVVEHAVARGDVILRHARLTDDAPDALTRIVDDLASAPHPSR
jgi:uncharacterized membrane protein